MTTEEKTDFVVGADSEMLRKIMKKEKTEKVLIQKAMEVFSKKLSEKGYNEEEKNQILKASEDVAKRKLENHGFAALWTIKMDAGSESTDDEQPQTIENLKFENLTSIFQRLNIGIEKLDFFILEIDPIKKEVLVSEKYGVTPSPIA